MNTKPTGLSLLWLGLCLCCLSLTAAEPAFRFEGGLTDGGLPANGNYDLTFRLFDAVTGGTSAGIHTNATVEVTAGVYEVLLPFPPTVLNFANRWIEVAARPAGSVNGRTVLSPRSLLTAVPYASRAALTDAVVPGGIDAAALQTGAVTTAALNSGAVTLAKLNLTGSGEGQSIVRRGSSLGWENLSFWSLTGNAGTAAGTDFIGTTDNQPLEFRVNNQRGLLIIPTAVGANIIAGADNNQIIAGRVAATISGGLANIVDGNSATIAGGQNNTASGLGSVVSGGRVNTASGSRSVVSGGSANNATAQFSTVGGGSVNTASGVSSTVAGGIENVVSGPISFIGGGSSHRILGSFGTIVAGQANRITNDYGFIGGGAFNLSGAPYALVGGGRSNLAIANYSLIGGGDGNLASGGYSAVGGGRLNQATGADTVVSGGRENRAQGVATVVSGGWLNYAPGNYAVVPGGVNNTASGFSSFAAGQFAGALHNGAFVWADNSGGAFSSTAEDQFLIRADGGVGIGLDKPQAALDVAGTVRASALQLPAGAAAGRVLTTDAAGLGSWQPVAVRLQISSATPNMVGGANNVISNSAVGATISGGYSNRTGHEYATISGGRDNRAYGANATVSGGRNNRVEGSSGTISGGERNTARDFGSTVGGGEFNVAGGYLSVVSGGLGNEVSGQFSTISGGIGNVSSGERATVGGGNNNRGDGHYGVAAGGNRNWATGDYSAVGGGDNNIAGEDHSAVGGGFFNTAAGRYSTVPGGLSNFALGESSYAAGQFSVAAHDGAFVWTDMSSSDRFSSTAKNQFLIRAGGGVGVGVNDPQAALDVAGTIRARTGGVQFPDGSLQKTAAFNGWSFSGGEFQVASPQRFAVSLGGQVGLRIEPNAVAPNFIAGATNNAVTAGRVGASIGGGFGNSVSASTGTVAGGQGNTAAGAASTVSGGSGNTAGGTRSAIVGGGENSVQGAFAVVGGGQQNSITTGGASGFIGGGAANVISAGDAVVAGGRQNRVSGANGNIGGGRSNVVSAEFSVVAGGLLNRATTGYAAVGGGSENTAAGRNSTVAGGEGNVASGRQSAVGGGWQNKALGQFSTVAGGGFNTASGLASFAAGQTAQANHDGSFVWADLSSGALASTAPNQFLIRAAGGVGIGTASPQAALHVNGSARVNALRIGDAATPGHVLTTDANGNGTWQSGVTDEHIQAVIAASSGPGSGLNADLLDGLEATAFAPAAHQHDAQYWRLGGNSGVAPNAYLGTAGSQALNFGVNGQIALRLIPTAVSPNILGGHAGNTVDAGVVGAVVAGGGGETGGNSAAGDFTTVSGGSGNVAAGMFATVPGGRDNTAAGDHSFAAGRRAQANHNGAIVLADGRDADFASTAANEFSARAFGGVRFVTGQIGVSSTGTRLAPGSGSWSSLSDRNAKTNIQPIDSREVLARVVSLPLATWSYRTQDDAIRHMGPMAQDFRAAFGLGEDAVTISSVDTDGVALAAIQGLNQKLDEKAAEVETLKHQNAELLRRLEAIEQRLK